VTVLDASAVLALLAGEPGRDRVGQELATVDCSMSAANWSEVWQKAYQHALPTPALDALGELIEIVPVERSHAERAAALWAQVSQLSLADRLCLALAAERDEVAMTADREWAGTATVKVELIR